MSSSVRIAALLLLPIWLAGCFDTGSAPQRRRRAGEPALKKEVAKPDEILPVTVMGIEAREIPLVIETAGKTVPSDRFQARVDETIKVEDVLVDVGQQVVAGEPVIRFDDELIRLKMENTRAEAREAEAALADYQYALQNRDQLKEQEKLSDAEADWLDKRIDHAEATLARTRTELPLLERQSQNTTISSPLAGVVIEKNIADGAMAAPGTILLQIVRVDPLRISFYIPQEYASAVERGGEIIVKFPHLPNQEFQAERYSIGTEVDPESRKLEVLATLANDGQQLKAGMDVEVRVNTNDRRPLIVVPDEAIYATDKSDYVFKLVDGDKLQRVPVTLGEKYGGQPTILKGLASGDQIVIASEKEPADGMKVKPTMATRAGK